MNEVERTLNWITESRAAGQPLVADEPYAVRTLQTHLGKVFYITCAYCGSGRCSKVRVKCNEFLAIHRAGLADPNWPRLTSDESAEIIRQIMESERAPSEALRGLRWLQ